MNEGWTFLGLAKDSWTLIGAGVAGLTGLWNFKWQWQDRHDSIFVGFGLTRESLDNYNAVHVVNVGKNDVDLKNYGLILNTGELFSIPWHWETSSIDDELGVLNGDRIIKPFGKFEAGIEYRGSVIGSWAITVTQRRPVLAFAHSTPLYKRLQVRLKTFVRPSYY